MRPLLVVLVPALLTSAALIRGRATEIIWSPAAVLEFGNVQGRQLLLPSASARQSPTSEDEILEGQSLASSARTQCHQAAGMNRKSPGCKIASTTGTSRIIGYRSRSTGPSNGTSP